MSFVPQANPNANPNYFYPTYSNPSQTGYTDPVHPNRQFQPLTHWCEEQSHNLTMTPTGAVMVTDLPKNHHGLKVALIGLGTLGLGALGTYCIKDRVLAGTLKNMLENSSLIRKIQELVDDIAEKASIKVWDNRVHDAKEAVKSKFPQPVRALGRKVKNLLGWNKPKNVPAASAGDAFTFVAKEAVSEPTIQAAASEVASGQGTKPVKERVKDTWQSFIGWFQRNRSEASPTLVEV